MSSMRKYANLPDLDAAPDVYETPELTDDNSTVPTSTTLRSDSPDSLQANESFGDDTEGIDRHKINQDEARTRFLPANERRQISSGRIAERRKAHKSHERRRRWLETDGIINGLETPSDGEEESLERKVARLRREISEVQDEAKRRAGDAAESAKEADAQGNAEATKLAQLLDAVDVDASSRQQNAISRFNRHFDATRSVADNADGSGTTKDGSEVAKVAASDPTPSDNKDRLTMVASLDARLKSLEDVLGLDVIPAENQNDSSTIKPLLPALNALDKQYHTLTTTSESSIDRIRDRVRKLTDEAETLESKRAQAKRALEAASSSTLRSRAAVPPPAPAPNAESNKPYDVAEDAEQTAKINALYGTLGTIDSMAPLLPSVLERLRSLRELHANAADASQGLAQVEKAQEEMRDELRSWREGLERVEKAMQQNRGTLKENMDVVEGWVKELEERMRSLS